MDNRNLTPKELQQEVDRLMNDGLSDSSIEIPEMFSDSGSSYKPSASSDSSDEKSNNEMDVDENQNSPMPFSALSASSDQEADTIQSQNQDEYDRSDEVQDEWVDTDSEPTVFDFTEQEGLKVNIPITATPKEIFEILFDQQLFEKISSWVNHRAQFHKNKELSRHSNMKSWKNTNPDEIRRFLGLCLLMGNISMPCVKNYWSKNCLYYHPIFGQTMSRNRFESILRCLCFYKEDDDLSSRLHKINQVLEHTFKNIRNIFYPGKNLSLDEALLLWRGRLQFRQYIPNKKAKYGIKLYELCTPDGFVLEILIYSGKGTVNNETGHAQSVVTSMVGRYLGKGHTLYLDNYYNSVKLAEFLYENKTNVVGTLRKTRKGNPKVVVSAKLKKGESIFRKKGKVLVMKWKDKRDVLMISTLHSSGFGTCVNKRGAEKEKPVTIIDYNKFMSGVDRTDQMVSYYTTPRKTIRWYLKVFFHLVDICVWNSNYLYNKIQPKKTSYLHFRDLLILELLKQETGSVQQNSSATTKINHYPKKIEKRLRCRFCSSKKRRSQTFFVCELCKDKDGHLIGLCVDPCFKDYHENSV